MTRPCRFALRFVALFVVLSFLPGCAAVRRVFGEPYYWQGVPPPRSAQRACVAACSPDLSERNGQMCAFACSSWRDPWYSAHPEVR